MIGPSDAAHLDAAIAAARASGRATAPNPRVGAVVTDAAGRVVATGRHLRAGGPHAERHALDAAGEAARGGTLYVSLEPCAHQGRQPPCTDRILAAGIARVVVGTIDPDPNVCGRGIGHLREAGVTVDLAGGDLEGRAREAIEDYVVHRREGRAFAALKVAATLDGRIADRQGASRWITGEAARAHGRALRAWYGAILVGAGTVHADDPALLPPPDGDGPPFVRCVIDPRLTLRPAARLFERAADHPVIVFCPRDPDPARRAALEAAGSRVVPLDGEHGAIDPRAVLRWLGSEGVLGVLIEGGGRTHGRFLAAGAWDKLYWYSAPSILGDPRAVPAVDAGERALAAAFAGVRAFAPPLALGDDILLTLVPRPAAHAEE